MITENGLFASSLFTLWYLISTTDFNVQKYSWFIPTGRKNLMIYNLITFTSHIRIISSFVNVKDNSYITLYIYIVHSRGIVVAITGDLQVRLYGDLEDIFPRNLLRRFVISGLPVKWMVKSIKTVCFSGECTRRYESYRKELARAGMKEKFQDREGRKMSDGFKRWGRGKGTRGEEPGSSLIKWSHWFVTESKHRICIPPVVVLLAVSC